MHCTPRPAWHRASRAVALLACTFAASAHAQEAPLDPGPVDPSSSLPPTPTQSSEGDDDAGSRRAIASELAAPRPPRTPGADDASRVPRAYGARARARAPLPRREQAASVVTRIHIEERAPRSAPDALRYEPGVAVQQTAHGQASPFVRAMTGQQVVHLFDGVRLNNGIYRQGPNQYFFTVDSLALERIVVVRGAASVPFGSDALGGAILAEPVQPPLDPIHPGGLRPRLFASVATADVAAGGRLELSGRIGGSTAFVGGIGGKDVSRLEAGGPARSVSGLPPMVPRFERDGRTQLGTGWRELTFDTRVGQRIAERLDVLGAVHGYRQFDAPRTDQCPPPEAPIRDCLRIAEQFRTLALVALRGQVGPLERLDLTLSYQRHHEVRRLERPRSAVALHFRDDVDTWGLVARASGRALTLGPLGQGRWHATAEAYRDTVDSVAFQTFTDLQRTFALPRGQYADGATYTNAGTAIEMEARPLPVLGARAGMRLTIARALARGDEASGTRPVDASWYGVVAAAGIGWRPASFVELVLNVDQGWRAPNLDDLTSRQQTGPGFQFENPSLRPEVATTFEAGTLLETSAVQLALWGFVTRVRDPILRALRTSADCPPMTPACSASRVHLQLVNADRPTRILGMEAGITWRLPARLAARATLALTRGDATDPATGRPAPLSRVPPPQGTAELRWTNARPSVHLGAALRWALDATRLAPTDRADARIPPGGTPGYAVVDLRGSLLVERALRIGLIVENVLDAPYRVHGSSILGPGRGMILTVSLEPPRDD
ncbi:MAG: TonB-dependent receptor [Myxococcota bacterium]|nr:TonB-dependent receptor [Myxococcota bacterium]MDW8362389.1 TonB-dependent receptor [Myxococcales bacterium]